MSKAKDKTNGFQVLSNGNNPMAWQCSFLVAKHGDEFPYEWAQNFKNQFAEDFSIPGETLDESSLHKATEHYRQ